MNTYHVPLEMTLTVPQRNKKVTMQHHLQVQNNFSRFFLSLHLFFPSLSPTTYYPLPPPHTHLLCVP